MSAGQLRERQAPRSSKRAKGTLLCACFLGVFGLLAPRSAGAHYVLEAPASYDVIDPESGLPEKQGPCGNEDPQTLTNTVTAFQEGQSITITINEVVFHPGHYRVALAMTPDHMQASFPDDPVPTPGSTNSGSMVCPDNLDMSACGSVPVEAPPVFPVLADNLFEHCMPFADPVTGNPQPQSTTIKLPAGVTCNKCTLQVLEFMSDHGPNVPGGCFYHHCADISIQAVDGGGPSGSGASGGGAKASGGCSTSLLPGGNRLFGTALAAIAAAVGLLFRNRRRARLL
jgi:hypothetical protein